MSTEKPEVMTLQSTLADATRLIEKSGGPVVVADDQGRAAGLVGDAELRLAAFRGDPQSAPVSRVMNTHVPLLGPGDDPAALEARLAAGEVDAALRVDEAGAALEVLAAPPGALLDTAVVMVGGEGTRLRPLTADTPKPLLPVAGKPILEHIVLHLARHGVRRIVLALGYLADQIRERFGDGSEFGLAIEYVHEEQPLGTAGAIGMVDAPEGRPLLVMNGDILTDIDLGAMARFHRRESAAVTVAARAYHHQVPYGVFKFAGRRVVALDEKPLSAWWANAGIYLMEPDVVGHIPADTYLDMTVFMEQLIAQGRPVVAFPMREYWCDIGMPGDYERANEKWGR